MDSHHNKFYCQDRECVKNNNIIKYKETEFFSRSLPIKVDIPEDKLKLMVEKYKEVGNWEAVSDFFDNEFTAKVIKTRVRNYFGKDFFDNLTKHHQSRTYIKNGKIYNFPDLIRNVICKQIYKFIDEDDLITDNELIDLIKNDEALFNEIPDKLLPTLNLWFNTDDNFAIFKNYLIALIKIVRKIKDHLELDKPLIMKQIAKELIDEGMDYFTLTQLGSYYLKDIVDYLNVSVDDQVFNRLRTNIDPDRIVYTYEKLEELAKERDGKLITTREEYNTLRENSDDLPGVLPIKWKCNNIEHPIFIARPALVKNANSWCPLCADNKFERILRFFLNYILSPYLEGRKFYKPRLSTIIEYIDARKYRAEDLEDLLKNGHLDLYAPIKINGIIIKLAMEFNGPHHYGDEDISLIAQNFNLSIEEVKKKFRKYGWEYILERGWADTEYEAKQMLALYQKNDKIKRDLCYYNNIILIEFPYWISPVMNETKKIQDFIYDSIEWALKIKLPRLPYPNLIDFYKTDQMSLDGFL